MSVFTIDKVNHDYTLSVSLSTPSLEVMFFAQDSHRLSKSGKAMDEGDRYSQYIDV